MLSYGNDENGGDIGGIVNDFFVFSPFFLDYDGLCIKLYLSGIFFPYPFPPLEYESKVGLEEPRLKRMMVSDESLELLSWSFTHFKSFVGQLVHMSL